MYFLLFLFENRHYRNWLIKKLICQIVHLNRKIFRVSNIEYKSCIKACISCVELIQVNGFLKSLFSSSTDFPCILSENWFENICSVRLFVSYSVAPLGFHILALLKLKFLSANLLSKKYNFFYSILLNIQWTTDSKEPIEPVPTKKLLWKKVTIRLALVGSPLNGI